MRNTRMLKYFLIGGALLIFLSLAATASAISDTTAPVVTNVVPVNGSTIYTNGGSTIYYQLGNTTPMVIKADYSDEAGGSGVDATSVMVHLDGMNMLSDCPVQTASHVECNATAADLFPGTHDLDVYVYDLAGNGTINHTTLTVSVDNQAPTYSNLMPAAGSTIHTSQLNSTGINDMSALRFDYDIADAAPSSGYFPMSHINDTSPPSVPGGMISNSSCVKTPTTNPTHYSCQANRASLLHLGTNTFSALLKDKVGNSNYSDPSSVSTYTVVDDVAPAISGITANPATIAASYADPLPTGALSTNLASGIDSGTAMVHVDGAMIMTGCIATSTGISCPTPAGLAPGSHVIEVMVTDNAGNNARATLSFTTGKPALSLGAPAPRWGSYADYTAGILSVDWTLRNTGSTNARSTTLTCAGNSNGVIMNGPATAILGDIAAGGSASGTLRYEGIVNGGYVVVGSWHTTNTGTALDDLGNLYTYPV
ncbi:MAG: hypothetical protein ACYC6Z_01790 [Thermoleophilia bacterium]